MTRAHSNWRSRTAAAVRGAVGAAVLLLGATSPAFGQAKGLEGVWGVTTQERNCSTNAPLGPPTRALITYQTGGTVDESRYLPVFAIGQLSAGHGIWVHDGGAKFVGRVVTMVQFDTPPNPPPGSPVFQAGWLVNTQFITMSGSDSFTMTGSGQLYNLDREVYRTGCASRTGERFK